MIRFLADENFDQRIVKGLLTRGIDIARVQEVGLSGEEDDRILEWAARDSRVLLTHDFRTVPPLAYERINSGHPMSGILLVRQQYPIGRAVQEIRIIAECSEQSDWIDQVDFLPL